MYLQKVISQKTRGQIFFWVSWRSPRNRTGSRAWSGSISQRYGPQCHGSETRLTPPPPQLKLSWPEHRCCASYLNIRLWRNSHLGSHLVLASLADSRLNLEPKLWSLYSVYRASGFKKNNTQKAQLKPRLGGGSVHVSDCSNIEHVGLCFLSYCI
jgi:hypothetical protein